MTHSLFKMKELDEPLFGTLIGTGEVGRSSDWSKSPNTSDIDTFSSPSSINTGQLGLVWNVLGLVGTKNPDNRRELNNED